MGVVPHKCTHTHTDWYHYCPRSISQYCCSREFSCCCSRCCNHGLCLKNSMQCVGFFFIFFCTQAEEPVGMLCSRVPFIGFRFCTPSVRQILFPAWVDMATAEFTFHLSHFVCHSAQNSGGQLQKYAAL